MSVALTCNSRLQQCHRIPSRHHRHVSGLNLHTPGEHSQKVNSTVISHHKLSTEPCELTFSRNFIVQFGKHRVALPDPKRNVSLRVLRSGVERIRQLSNGTPHVSKETYVYEKNP